LQAYSLKIEIYINFIFYGILCMKFYKDKFITINFSSYRKIAVILWINLLLGIATTIGMTILPILVTESLGFSLLVLGLIEGSTEFISNLLRLTNGILFDKLKNNKRIFIYPTALALVAKAILFIPSCWAILLAKIAERMSNGAFASPRDAYVAENSTNKGLALALISVSKTLGCVIGPLIVSMAAFFFGAIDKNISWFISICCVVCLIATIMAGFIHSKSITPTKFSFTEITTISKQIFFILCLGMLFFMGRFNDGILMLYLKQQDFPAWFYLATIAVFNFIMLLISPFIGCQMDKNKHSSMLYVTIGALLLFNLCFYQIKLCPWPFAICGLIFWGIQRAGAQIVFSALVFKSIPNTMYGTA
jgi:hypothetical protein